MILDLSRYSCLGEALRDPMVTFQTNVALIEADRHRENGRWEFRELRAEAERVAIRLQALGIKKGDRCAILMSNQAKWVISGIGALWAGCVLVPLDSRLTAAEQLALLRFAEPAVLITEYNAWRSLSREPPGVLTRQKVVVTEAPPGAELGAATRWEERVEGEFNFERRERNDIACVVFSSGTSGRPKGCLLTHDNYLEQAQMIGRLFPVEEGDRYFAILPNNHAVGFMGGMIIPLLFGATVVHQRTLRPEFIASTMKAYRITHTALVPRILRNLEKRLREKIDQLPGWKRLLLDGLMTANELATAREPNHKLSRILLKPIHRQLGDGLRLIIAGSAYVDPECASFFYRLGIPVAIGYGLTEACTSLTLNDLKPFRADTVGKPIPGIEIEIRDKNEGGIGEVYARARTVMKGYLNDSDLTRETIIDGWLRTGDLALIDASGHLKLVGRAKNMIVTAGGKNVYPEDIESKFESIATCEELCICAASYIWPGADLADETLVLIIRPKSDEPTAELLDEIRTRNRELADYQRVSSYMVWKEEFPRSAKLDVKRQQLAREIAVRLSRDKALRTL
ncbi:MAG: AMP-binding protein [Deltaproteobacteria bacterium]|nr:AMP-binding protein [Deltaproteobacteria bacterium]